MDSVTPSIEFTLPNSSLDTNFEAIERIAMNDVPLRMSTIEPAYICQEYTAKPYTKLASIFDVLEMMPISASSILKWPERMPTDIPKPVKWWIHSKLHSFDGLRVCMTWTFTDRVNSHRECGENAELNFAPVEAQPWEEIDHGLFACNENKNKKRSFLCHLLSLHGSLTIPRSRHNHHTHHQHNHLGPTILFALLECHAHCVVDVRQIEEIGQKGLFNCARLGSWRWYRRFAHIKHTIHEGTQLQGQRCGVDAVETDLSARAKCNKNTTQ